MRLQLAIAVLVMACGCVGTTNASPHENPLNLSEAALEKTASCDMMADQEGIDWCYVESAASLNETGICEAIGDASYRERCVWGVARALNDPSGCGKIGRQSIRRMCELISQKNMTGCGTLPGSSERQTCEKWAR